MKTLKDFSRYTKDVLSIEEYNAILLNANGLGFDNKMLVENSGFAIANTLRQKYKGRKICIVCGKGYLGAVGLSTARHLLNYADLTVILLDDGAEIKNQVTLFNYNTLTELIEINSVAEKNISDFPGMLSRNDIIVTAIIGNGLKGRLSKFMLAVVGMVNDAKKNTICIDTPTGIDPDKGTTNLDYIKSSSVLCLYKMKQGIANTMAIKNFASIIDSKIPLSAELLTGDGDVVIATEARSINANKYSNGAVLVVGGSEKYHGAPMLAGLAAENALAALRSGSGYATVIVPKSIETAVKKVSPDIIVNAVDFHDSDTVMKRIIETRHNSLVIGPGSGKEIQPKLLARILKYESEKGNACIIDGNAIEIIKENRKLLNQKTILTPHEGEFLKLSGRDLKGKEFYEKVDAVIEFAKSIKCNMVLKGNRTIISNGRLLKINTAANPSLAVMGAGDVLSGIIGSYAAVHNNAFESAVAGVRAHSKISNILFAEKGLHIIPDDIINAIPNELKKFDKIIR
ncbi:MAG: NAD(P)H-hydrate dehydratase [Candidatus Marsarchaeota archaeon]|nr:NAD(P)H-hydrate dehydratase [Candidatus Marsarchaeota archaeon]